MTSDCYTAINNSYAWTLGGLPYVIVEDGELEPVTDAPIGGCGAGSFVTDASQERGYNAWYGAAGYYVDAPFANRNFHEEYRPIWGYPGVGFNPWDTLFGPSGTPALVPATAAREYPDQSGDRSLS